MTLIDQVTILPGDPSNKRHQIDQLARLVNKTAEMGIEGFRKEKEMTKGMGH
jgi:hypothetical protein